jgi:2'-hydroxyisoflavone reductase
MPQSLHSTRRDFLRKTLTAAGVFGLAGMVPPAALRAFASEGDAHEQLTELMLRDVKISKARKPMKILVLGGTAFLGPACVEIARARGHELTLFNRGHTNPHLYPDLEQIHGDRKDGHEQLAGRKWDAVLDTSAYIPRVVEDATRVLGDNVDHYCLISTISVYASHAKSGMDETAEVGTLEDPTVEEVTGETYGPLKALCEEAAEKGMPGRVATIRPGLIVGPLDRSDRFTYWPVRVSRGGEVLAPNRPDQDTQFIDVRDLAAFAVRSMEERVSGVYNATSKAGQFHIGQLLETCKKSSGSDARFTWVDEDFLEEQEVEGWSELPCWVPTTGEYAGIMEVDVGRALKKGLKIRPLEQTVSATLDWWSSQPEAEGEKRTELRAGIAPEKEAKVLAAWHAKVDAGEG